MSASAEPEARAIGGLAAVGLPLVIVQVAYGWPGTLVVAALIVVVIVACCVISNLIERRADERENLAVHTYWAKRGAALRAARSAPDVRATDPAVIDELSQAVARHPAGRHRTSARHQAREIEFVDLDALLKGGDAR